MEPVTMVAVFALLFVGTHVGLSTGRVRGALVARLGEGGFTAFYLIVASLTWAGLITAYAAHRFDGPAGLALGATALRWPLMLVIVVGMALLVTGFAVYPALPSALFAPSVPPPRGIARVTRHPFFAGVALVFVAHALLATRLVGAIVALALAVLAIVGGWHQDRKLQARHDAYGAYLAATSAVPFAAIVAGRQRLAWRELPIRFLAAGVVVAVVLRSIHASLFAAGGLWMIVALVGGGLLATVQAAARARRVAARPAARTAPRAQSA